MKIGTRPVLVMHPSTRLHRRISLLSGREYAYRPVSGWGALRRALEEGPPSALVVLDPSGPDGAGGEHERQIHALPEDCPMVPVIAALDPHVVGTEALRMLGRRGLVDLVVLGHDDTPTALVERFRRAHSVPLKRIVKDLLPRELSPQARSIVDAAAELAADAGLARGLCGKLRLSKRILSRVAERSALPPPRRLMAWMRTLLAAALLNDQGHSVLSVARACGFSSDAGLRRLVSKQLGMSPSTLRERGAVRTASEAFAEALARYARRARVTSPADRGGEARRAAQVRPPPSTGDASRRNRLLQAGS